MDREQLAARHTGAIRRHWRNLSDTDGRPTVALLDELAVIADDHADDVLHEEVGVTGPAHSTPKIPARNPGRKTRPET